MSVTYKGLGPIKSFSRPAFNDIYSLYTDSATAVDTYALVLLNKIGSTLEAGLF